VFEWVLGGQFLAQHEEMPHPDAPDSSAIIGFDPDSQAYTQHYFDSRGIAHVCAKPFSEGLWTLLRETPTSRRSTSAALHGTFSDDGKTIAGRWESRTDVSSWELDFDLTYTELRQLSLLNRNEGEVK